MTDFARENARAADLVRRIARGQRACESELVELYDRRLMVKLRHHVSDPDGIRDLRQEVWIRILQALRRGDVAQPERFHGFLLGTARNVVREHLKAAHRAAEHLDTVAMVPDPSASIERILDQAYLSERLHECLAGMGERDREILVRHYIREEPKEVTCGLLGLSALNYNNVLHRARRRMADLLAGQAEAGTEAVDFLARDNFGLKAT